jgi:hypothetical protein
MRPTPLSTKFMKINQLWRSRQLLAALCLVSIMVAPAIAEGTKAGTKITNEAAATYQDPNNPSETINAVSNKVEVTVTEVAGLTVTPLSTVDENGGTVLPNDIINYDFKITNVGNDTTGIHLPDLAAITGPGTLNNGPTPADQYAYSVDGGTTWVPITSGTVVPNVAAGASVIVRVPVQVNPLASSGAPILVQLGNTGTNDNTPGTQNQLDSLDGATANEIRTQDNPDTTPGETPGVLPATAEKEAAASQQLIVGSQPQAFATVLKTNGGYSDKGTAAQLNDDELTYKLGMRVEAIAPPGSTGLSPSALTGITVNGIGPNRILIADAIPTNTTYTAGSAVSANLKWVPVYSSDAAGTPATAANWTAAPGATVTRVGFVYDAAANGPLPVGTTVTGLSFKVTTTGVTTTSTIANMAQLFGQTDGNSGPDKPLVYDESGDQSPSNFNENGTPGPTATLTPNSPPAQIPTGVSNPTNDGVDNNNDNTGNGPGGEDNVYTVAALGAILTGPNATPAAVGPTSNNDDFSNRSSIVDPNVKPGTLIDPAAVTFSNTLQNPAPVDPADPTKNSLTNVLLVPDAANFTPIAGQEQLPPNGTKVTLTYGGQTAIYRYDQALANFVFESGSTIIIPTLKAGESVNYSVSVDLPINTPLSADSGVGYAIPIMAFKDVDNDGRPGTVALEPTQNRTIDRVYVGFLRLEKMARVLDAAGQPVAGPSGTFSKDKIDSKDVKPGNFIEYRIQYTNISIAPIGAGNTILNANNISIIEDGILTPNTWALDQDVNGIIDTSHVPSSVTSTFGSTAYFPSGEQSGITAAQDVTKYLHKPGVVIQPGATGEFVFRRVIN